MKENKRKQELLWQKTLAITHAVACFRQILEISSGRNPLITCYLRKMLVW